MGITIVNETNSELAYQIYGAGSGVPSGSGIMPSGSGIWPSGSGVGPSGSGVVPAHGTVSGIPVSGYPSYTVVFGAPAYGEYTVSASGVVTVTGGS